MFSARAILIIHIQILIIPATVSRSVMNDLKKQKNKGSQDLEQINEASAIILIEARSG